MRIWLSVMLAVTLLGGVRARAGGEGLQRAAGAPIALSVASDEAGRTGDDFNSDGAASETEETDSAGDDDPFQTQGYLQMEDVEAEEVEPNEGLEPLDLFEPIDTTGGEEFFEPGGVGPAVGGYALAVGVPNMRPGFRFQAGLLYLQPSADNLGWGILTTEHNYASPYPLATPLWNVKTLQPGYQPGFELGTGYTFAGTGRDAQLNWQHLRTNTYDSGVAGDGQWISPFSQTGPPTADTYDELNSNSGVNKLRSANAQVKFSYDAVNLDFGQYVNVGQRLLFRLFAGLSYAQLREQLNSTFYGVEPSPTAPFPENTQLSIALNNTTSFWGVGPRFGFDSSYLTKRGLRLTGQLAGAALIGQTQPAQYQFAATSPDLALLGIAVNREYVASSAFSHVVYAANAKLGIGYTRVLRGGSVFTFDTGYLAAIYFNPFAGYETNENILALQIGSLSSGSIRHIQQSNFSLNGFYLNAGLNW